MATETASKSVLLTGTEVFDYLEGDHESHLPKHVFEPIIAERRADPSVRDGAIWAAELLLTQAATAIQFVDTDSHWEEELKYRRPWHVPGFEEKKLLGFNDHGGGSDSKFKLLLNQHAEDGTVTQYVLYTPPNHDGSPSNRAFHHAMFDLLIREPKGPALKDVPNQLKTTSEVGRFDDRRPSDDYEYILFGDASTPGHFLDLFKAMGFQFFDRPYSSEEHMSLQEILWAIPDGKYDKYEGLPWPGPQFAAEVAKLGEIAASR